MASDSIHFPEKDQPLRLDVGALGALLGDVLKEQGPAGLFERVEAARRAARARRAEEEGAEQELADLLADLSPRDAHEVVRAFSAYFGLVNMAERVHRIRRRIDYLRDPATPQPASVEAALREARDAGVPAEDARAWLGEVILEPVFTAHPTEAIRRTLLVKEQRIARALLDRIERAGAPPREERALWARIREEVTAAWQTEEHLSVRPSVTDEVEHVLFFVSDVIYRIVPSFLEQVEDAFAAVYGDEAAADLPLPRLRFGSWVGGDMDGNPNVGAETIRHTLERHLELVVRRYRREVEDLFGRLSQSSSRVSVSPTLAARTEEYRSRMPGVHAGISPRYLEMPYRVFLWLVASRLDAVLEGGDEAYAGPEPFLEDLRLVARSLEENHGEHSGRHRVLRLIRRVQTFGFHLAALDVRQDARVHRRVVAHLLGDPDFPERPAEERAARLADALSTGARPDLEAVDEEGARVLAVMDALRRARRRYGPDCLGSSIISMAQGPDDALAVLYLARAGGLVDDEGRVPLDVAPLFETVPDLEGGPDTLEALLDDPVYREHLRARGDVQVIMLGYSDSNKESGIAASRNALAAAQYRLVQVADAAGVRPVLFHGRGGSVSRGGGKPRDAIRAAPPGCVRGHVRVTEQGEILAAKFGLRGIALRTLDLMTAALVERKVHRPPEALEPQWEAIAGTLHAESRAAYRALVHEDEDLPRYFRRATPIDVIERLRMGSRPSKRQEGDAGLEGLRAIPWVFAWTQSRHVLPGWYGVGAGLQAAREAHGLDALREAARGWPLLRTLLSDVAMVLAKADMPIAQRYASLAGDLGERIFPRIRAEYDRTRALVCEVRETDALLDDEPVLQRALRLRNPYVDPMSFVQVDLLRRWREGGREDPELERVLATTVQGIARGLLNTG